MNVASLELCCELYKLSGWDDDTLDHYFREGTIDEAIHLRNIAPKYNLGYLMRKLPWGCTIRSEHDGRYSAGCIDLTSETSVDNSWQEEWADTPENAACKLLCELFKEGILKKEGV